MILRYWKENMVYLGVNSNTGGGYSTTPSSSGGQSKNGSRSPPELVDLDTEKPNERNGGKRIILVTATQYIWQD